MNGINKAQFTSKTLTCIDCGKAFQFSSGEAAFFWSKRLSEPKRCRECRRSRRERLVPEGVSYADR